jgi:hypothetical protein
MSANAYYFYVVLIADKFQASGVIVDDITTTPDVVLDKALVNIARRVNVADTELVFTAFNRINYE